MTTTNAPNAVRAELHRLALLAAGRTGADIERIVRELRGAARRNKRGIEWRDLEEALTNDGRPQRGPDLLWRIAVHEAGHAIAYSLHPGLGEVQTVSIAAAEGGETSVRLHTDALQTAAGLDQVLVCLLAGRAAERLVLGEPGVSSGGRAESDLAHATRLALESETTLGLSEEKPLLYRPPSQPGDFLHLNRELAASVHGRLEAAEAKAMELLREHERALMELARQLVEHQVIDGTSARAVLTRYQDHKAGQASRESAIPNRD
jgi:ATP-dependent Zn protease